MAWDAFVMKLSPMGRSVSYSTFIGGGDLDMPEALALDAGGRGRRIWRRRDSSSPGALKNDTVIVSR